MKIFLVTLITCFCSVISIGQNKSIGLNYSARYFPLEAFAFRQIEDGKYKTDLPEHVIKIVFRARSNFHKNTIFFVSPIFTYGKYDYTIKGGNGNATYDGDSYISTARYEYCFLGLELGLIHVFDISSKFSLGLGISGSLNSLVSETTYRKERHWTNFSNWYPQNGTDNSVADLHTTPKNAKIELPFSMQWNFEKTALQIVLSSGVSSQCRDNVNYSKANFFVSPQIAYFIKLGKPKTNSFKTAHN